MIKTLSQALRMDKERFKVPKSVQQAIPIQRIWPDGIFQQGTKFSKTYRFTDINYYIASKDNKTEMFLDYSELLNSLDSGISAKITINNRRINKEEFEKSILLPMKEDGLDHYREEYNEMLLSKITGTNNSIYQERYLTVSVHKRSIDDARTYFARIGTDIVTHLAKLSSTAEGLDAESRLQIFRDFFKGDVPQAFPFDLKQFAKKGTSFKDWMCPDSMEFERDHFKIGDRYGRVLYMQDYASYVKDDMISELCDFSRNLMLSIDILPVPTDEAVREIQNRLLGVETNVTNWQRRQNANNNFSAIVPYDMELQRKETKEMLDDLTTRDQRMMFGILTMVHLADSKKQLDSDTELLLSVARKHLCQMSTLKWQQVDGLNTVLPYGLRKLNALRTLTTESTAVLIPFHTQEILQPGGIYYGQNAVSKNLLVADRKKLMNGNSFRLGVSGSGKSFSAKEEIVHLALSTDDDILILDPESEFTKLVEALGGQVVKVSATSDNHLNAMDMDAASAYEKQLADEMETTLSAVTNSYLRSEDIISSVKENLKYIKPPLYSVFEEFLTETEAVSPDIKSALINMSDKTQDGIFKEWVLALVRCQDDRTLKDTLLPIVARLSDVRRINTELSGILRDAKNEYLMMVLLVVGNIPLLYLLNRDWFNTLIYTTPGKVVTGICGAVILVTFILMKKYTKPVKVRD